MAKQQQSASLVKAEEPASTALAAATQAGLTSQALREDAADLHFDKDDLAIPFIRILQALSPQVVRSKPEFIADARAGEFFNTVSQQRWDGETGILFVPCSFTRNYTEWKIREEGGGLVKAYGADLPAGVRDPFDLPRDDRGRSRLPNGNQLVAAARYYGMIVDPESGDYQQVVYDLTSTQMKKARKWNALIAGCRAKDPHTNESFRPAMFYMAYRLTTVAENNEQGDWFGVKIVYATPVLELPNGGAIYLAAREFKKLIESGKVQVREPGEEEIVEGDVVDETDGEKKDDLPF